MNDDDPIGPDLTEAQRAGERRAPLSRLRRLVTDARTVALVVAITAACSAAAIGVGAWAIKRDLATRDRVTAIERPSPRELVARVVLALDACNRDPACRARLRAIFLSVTG